MRTPEPRRTAKRGRDPLRRLAIRSRTRMQDDGLAQATFPHRVSVTGAGRKSVIEELVQPTL